MKLDRAEFLCLAATMAAACGGGGASPVPVATSVEPIEPTPVPRPADAPVPPPTSFGDCGDIEPPPGPECENIYLSMGWCRTLANVLDEVPSREAVACMVARSGTEDICEFDAIEACYAVATKASDTRHEKACSIAVQSCHDREGPSDLDTDTCMRLLTAVQDPFEEEMARCLGEICGGMPCMNSLKR